MTRSTVMVVAKEPVAGRSKTRLCPPCNAAEAAAVAEVALAHTLEAAIAAGVERRLLALDGSPGPWLPPGFEVVPQADGDLGRRLAHAWSHIDGPCVQVGMDTPQVTGANLDAALAALDGADAALGPAVDGGWWALAMGHPEAGMFDGVAMSRADTGIQQRRRLTALGLAVVDLPPMRDVDTFDDAVAVAAAMPGSDFAGLVAQLSATVGMRSVGAATEERRTP